MLSSLANMFKVPDLRKKILFVLMIVAFYRLGTLVPVPGVRYSELANLQEQANSGALGLFNLFSGGALANVAVFALGIMPNITASIIMQLLAVVIPKLEQWREEGETGQKKITQWTRYLTLVLALIQSSGLAYLFSQNNLGGFGGGTNVNVQVLGPNPQWYEFGLIVITMTAGTVLVMWMGELITQRGIGNGMSILIFVSVIATLPTELFAVYRSSILAFIVIIIAILAMLVGIVFIESGERRIQVQFAKRIVGRRQTAGGSTYIPLKVNTGGVVPVIFATSMLQIPVLFVSSIPNNGWGNSLRQFVNDNLVNPQSWIYITTYFVLVIGFAYFYNMIQFDPYRQADFLKKQGGYIPGVRPGEPTAKYFSKILNRITLPGALYLAFIAISPVILIAALNVGTFSFLGTSLLITVGVGLETMKQIDSQLMMRNYESFLSAPSSKQ